MKKTGTFSGEKGSASLEACVSLTAFIIAIAFVYSQIQVIICENIMQNAVNNMALEVSSYTYIVDRVGLVMHQQNSEGLQQIDDMQGKASEAMDEFSNAIGTLHGGINGETISAAGSSADNMFGSLKEIVEIFKQVNWSQTGKDAGKYVLNEGIDSVIGSLLEGYYMNNLTKYIPSGDLDTFCDAYNVEKSSITFEPSCLFPGNKNNTVLVAVKYETRSPFSMFPVNRTIVKKAFTAVWLADPTLHD